MAQSINLGSDTFLDASAVYGFKGTITSSDNLDDYKNRKHSGIYYANGITMDGSTTWGMLIVMANAASGNGFVSQMFVNGSTLYAREQSGNPVTWGDWKRLASFGQYKTQNKDNISVTSGTAWQDLDNVTLTEGIWFIDTVVRYSSNATGRRAFTISSSSDSAGNVRQTDVVNAVNGEQTYVHITTVEVVAAGGTTIYLKGMQNSGSTLTAVTRFTATRIG